MPRPDMCAYGMVGFVRANCLPAAPPGDSVCREWECIGWNGWLMGVTGLKVRKLTELAMLTAVALILFVVELQIPNPFPIHCLCGLPLSRKRSVPFGSSPHFIGLFFWWRDDDPYVQYGRRFILPCWDAVVKEVPFRKVYLDL